MHVDLFLLLSTIFCLLGYLWTMGSIKFLGGKLCQFFKVIISLLLFTRCFQWDSYHTGKCASLRGIKYKENNTYFVTFKI